MIDSGLHSAPGAEKSPRPAPSCRACGDCCRKGGPVLHLEDAALVPGVLPLSRLVTLRVGELAFDPVAGEVTPLRSEVIKVKGLGRPDAPWQCVLLEGEAHCRIYADRPAQCRALFCEDTKALEALYKEGRLTRADILGPRPGGEVAPGIPEGWLALAEGHEEDCHLPDLVPLARQALDDRTAMDILLQALRFDTAYRELCTSKGGVQPDEVDCLLGRPLAVFLESFGLGLVSNSQGEAVLERISVNAYSASAV